LGAGDFVVNLGWGTTWKCNMHCSFCYSGFARGIERRELDIQIKKRFLIDNIDRIKSINFGTSENVLADDFFDLLKFIRTLGKSIRVAITTNGSLINSLKKTEPRRIFSECVDEVDVSLDSANRHLHDKLRGYTGAFDLAEATIDECKKMGKVCTVATTLMKDVATTENIKGLIDLVSSKDCFLRFNICRPSNKQFDFVISSPALYSILAFCLQNLHLVQVSDVTLRTWLGMHVEYSNEEVSVRLLPNGWITLSPFLISRDYYIENITQCPNLKDIGNHVIQSLNHFHNTIPPDCTECLHVDSCRGGEAERRLLWYNDLDQKDPYCPLQYIEQPLKEARSRSFSLIHGSYLPTIIFQTQ